MSLYCSFFLQSATFVSTISFYDRAFLLFFHVVEKYMSWDVCRLGLYHSIFYDLNHDEATKCKLFNIYFCNFIVVASFVKISLEFIEDV